MTSSPRFVTAPDCLRHQAPFGYPEQPARLRRILERVAGDVLEAPAHPATREAVLQVHTEAYWKRFKAAVDRGDGLFGSADNPIGGPGTWDAAVAAVDATLTAVERMLAAPGSALFAAVRPPGHHAERELAMGFCYFNNVAVAAGHLLAAHGLERVAIYDFDVHHGNGTQHLFEERGEVLYASIHQYPFYPGTGAADERGRGVGEGATVNVPLPAGCGDREYEEAFDRRVLPALEDFAPEALLISAGFDAWRGDPVGGMRVGEEAFERWGERLGAFAREACGGRTLSLLEGGYDLDALPRLVERYVDGLERGLAGAGGRRLAES